VRVPARSRNGVGKRPRSPDHSGLTPPRPAGFAWRGQRPTSPDRVARPVADMPAVGSSRQQEPRPLASAMPARAASGAVREEAAQLPDRSRRPMERARLGSSRYSAHGAPQIAAAAGREVGGLPRSGRPWPGEDVGPLETASHAEAADFVGRHPVMSRPSSRRRRVRTQVAR